MMTSFYEELNKRDIISDESENAKSRKIADKWIFGILLSIIGFMPLIVAADIEDVVSPLVTRIDALASGAKGELFTSYKAMYLLVATLIASVLLLAKIYFMNGQIKKTPLNYVLALFAIGIVVSTVLSPTVSIALNGQYNRSDGMITWLCYVALMFIALNIEYPKKIVSYTMYSLLPFVYINLVIISLNFYNKDLLKYSAMQKIVSIFLPEGANISEGSQLVGTLNQWNFMSGTFAVMAVMFLTWSLIEKSWVKSIVALVTAVSSLAVVLMSLSTSGFLTFSLLFVVVLFIVVKLENKIRGILLIVAMFVVIAPIFHILALENERVWSESLGFVLTQNPYVKEKIKKTSYNQKDWLIDNKVYAAEKVIELPVLPDSGISAGTGRTYIWSKTFEQLQNRPLIGYGLDTLMYNFPHYNIDARGGLRTEQTIVDKPHSMYMGILFGTGIIGTLGFLGILLFTILSSLKVIVTNRPNRVHILIVAWLAFLVQALFNDTLPGTTAPMWIIAGLMMGLLINNNLKGESEN